MVPRVNFTQLNKQQQKEEEVDQKQIIFSVYWSNTGFLNQWPDGNRQNSLKSRHGSLEWASSTLISHHRPLPVTQKLRGEFFFNYFKLILKKKSKYNTD